MSRLEKIEQFTLYNDAGQAVARRTVHPGGEKLMVPGDDGEFRAIELTTAQLADLAELYGFGASSVDPAGPQRAPNVDPAAVTETHGQPGLINADQLRAQQEGR